MLQRAVSTSSLSHSSSHCLALSRGLFTLARSHFRLRFRADWSVTSRVYVNVCDEKSTSPHLTSGFPLFSPQEQGFCCLCLSSPLRECHSLSEVLSKRDKRKSSHAVNSNVCLDMKTSGVFYGEEKEKKRCRPMVIFFFKPVKYVTPSIIIYVWPSQRKTALLKIC